MLKSLGTNGDYGMNKDKILVVSTGGTISSKYTRDGGYAPSITARDLVSSLGGIDESLAIETFQYANVLSHALSPHDILDLVNLVKSKTEQEHYSGIVITQGTATMEETSYLADLMWDREEPLVFTGAMQNASERDWDGPRNVFNSILVAASPDARGKGVLVCMGNEIHAARDVTKIHKSALNAFVSLNSGALGIVSKDRVVFYRKPLLRKVFPVKDLELNVEIVKVGLGTSSRVIDFLLSSGTKGIVLEAFPGGGGVTPDIMKSIRESRHQETVFILTPRSPIGSVISSAGGGSGPVDLLACGVINGGDLSPVKARILLMATLPLVRDRAELQKIFSEVAP